MTGTQRDPLIMVGGGVIGACCAYFPREGDVRLLPLEENESLPAAHSSFVRRTN
jgi:glycine/D-amino acid oxidase-like deaminating enzyme